VADDEDDWIADPALAPADWAAQLHHFWFVEHGTNQWFARDDTFDVLIRDRFVPWRDALRSLPPEQFTGDAATALAAVLLFDQVPRNTHRDHAEAFATDDLARAITRAAVAAGLDRGLSVDERLFLYLPFEHSESAADQRESVRLISALGDDSYTRFAMMHAKVIDQFGRFPHRNAAIGRADRPGEAEAVAAGAAF
jgi:uncharacterized protein (DUF924 family)